MLDHNYCHGVFSRFIKLDRLISNVVKQSGKGNRPINLYTWFLLSSQVIRLESQVSRYKLAAENAEKIEDELKAEKRKLQREVNFLGYF